MPYPVVVTTLVAPPVVTVVVMTLLAVVLAVQPAQDVHGALVPQGPLVQPDQVDGGQPEVPHQLVHGPFVQEPVVSELYGPQPLPAPPNGPCPFPPAQPVGWFVLLYGFVVGAPVMVAKAEAYDCQAVLVVG